MGARGDLARCRGIADKVGSHKVSPQVCSHQVSPGRLPPGDARTLVLLLLLVRR